MLTDAHWAVIGFMREYFEQRQIVPDARHVIKHPGRVQGAETAAAATSCSRSFPTAT